VRWNFAVQDAASRRRAGLPDPLAGVQDEPPTFRELEQLGFTEQDIRLAAFGGHLMWVGLLLAVHDREGAAEHLGCVRRYLDPTSLEQRALYLVARGRTQFADREPFRSVSSVLAAFALEPGVAARALAHPVVGSAGRAVYRRLPGDGGGAPGRWLRGQIVDRLNGIG